MVRSLLRPLLATALLLSSLFGAAPAWAAVTITFWSHELGNSFPHAFFTLRGVPDAGGAPVDANYGFTAKSVSPKLLMGTVAGRLDISKPFYIAGSDAQFSVVLTDAQYNAVLGLVAAWDEKTGDAHYNLNQRNCVHFVKEAARIAGLTDLDRPKLMKKPRSYLQSIAEANAGRVTVVKMHGKAYLATLPPLATTPVVAPAVMAAPAAPVAAPATATTPVTTAP
ncbi:hypothetical protein AVM11_07400 [Sphingomonas melonis TY]|jgi:hypothetical protein|uniref:Uncharacterized protein n=1 Tax=Sphingomonas melonis TY TaxID=621456 RepID=A0A175Y131_9SPHN|nr:MULTISPECIES: hypothetical protein [Sphingomonas]AOW23194.1 hypothetical protein BJP26_06065 [Sphingomonas melonis TY]ATI56627.1 hypothetical protein CP552_13295 [Sphingomonas melonis]KZB94281.1 hypothetical protein AVM11_07400 [Sphingomonas melonis TY]MBI0530183.1 hypothetical protein [Sphingomonas sp. TX0522]MBX8845518.1 hypothetical protein [Sphingomonas melonis]